MAESPPVSNLFTKLHTWKGKKPQENFVTDSLVYVLQYLLHHESKEGRELFGALTGQPGWLPESRCKKVTVCSQPSVKRGRPDIEISCKGRFCIYVEVKVEAQLGKDQLKRYLKALKEKKKLEEKDLDTQLVLLTKGGGANQDEVHSVTWDKIITSLKGLKKKFRKTSISGYLTTQLHDFFEQQKFYEGEVKSKHTGKRFNVWLVSMNRKSPTDPGLNPWKQLRDPHYIKHYRWSAPRRGVEGDLVLLYRAGRKDREDAQVISDIFAIDGAVVEDPDLRYVTPYHPIAELDISISNRVHLDDLRKDSSLKEVAGRLRRRRSVSPYWPELYKLIVRKNPGIKAKLKNYEPAEA